MAEKSVHQLEISINDMKKSLEDSQKLSETRHESYQKNDEEHKKAVEEISTLLKDYIKQDTLDKEEAKKWRQDVTPSIQTMQNITSWSRTTTILLKTIIVLGTAISVVYGLWKFIIHTGK